jgi:phosphohistidine phosphatase SixA
MVRGLRPDDPPQWVADMLEVEDGEVLLVGHMPSIAQLAIALGASGPTPTNGLVTLERVGPREYVERWRAVP